MSALREGIKTIPAPTWTDDPQLRIAVALEGLAGCTGWIDPETGQRQHDGETCPLHEGQDEVLDTPPADWWLTRFRDWMWRNAGL
jgi:hypothetical protein